MAETSDKLKFVGHFPRPFALLPNSPAVSLDAAFLFLDLSTANQKKAASKPPHSKASRSFTLNLMPLAL